MSEAAEALAAPPAPTVPEDYDGPVVRLVGGEFRIADKVGHLAVMRFAKLAKRGVDSSDLDGLAGMYDLLQQVVHPDDWQAFEDWGDQVRSDSDELLDAVMDALEAATGRNPTQRSASSDGQSTTKGNSRGDSSSLVILELERRGRPDLGAFVQGQQEFDSRRSG